MDKKTNPHNGYFIRRRFAILIFNIIDIYFFMKYMLFHVTYLLLRIFFAEKYGYVL